MIAGIVPAPRFLFLRDERFDDALNVDVVLKSSALYNCGSRLCSSYATISLPEDMPCNESNFEASQSSEPMAWPSDPSGGGEPDARANVKPGPKAPRFIVVEGPLRVGKTTLAKILADKLHARRLYDCEDNPFLSDFYKEKPGSALRTQMYFLMERQKRIREALAAATLLLRCCRISCWRKIASSPI